MFDLLSTKQKQELIQYVLEKVECESSIVSTDDIVPTTFQLEADSKLTEIYTKDLYFCLENRLVYVQETEIMLTVKEFDIFSLLIMNPHRVLTYDMIVDLVWHENLDYYSHRAINNHVSNLRRKLKVTPETPDYIKSVHSVGYKFNPNIELY